MSDRITDSQGNYLCSGNFVSFQRGLCITFENWEGLEKFMKLNNSEMLYIEGDKSDGLISVEAFKQHFYRNGDAIYVTSEHEMKARTV